jgi:hypothetical protein
MEKNKYQILKRHILSVKLHSLTGQYWFNSNGVAFPWSGSTGLSPNIGDLYFNVSGGTVPSGYYKWNGSTWVQYNGNRELDYDLPIFLENYVDEFGVMVGFDGDITHIEHLCNFTYTQTGSTIQIYNTADPNILRKIVDQTFTVDWGDGTINTIGVTDATDGNPLPTLTHTFPTPLTGQTNHNIYITFNSPWSLQKTTKTVSVPQDLSTPNPFGVFSGFTIPYSLVTGQTQNYLNDLDYTSVHTGNTTFQYASIGKSRVSELKLYGSNIYSGVTTGTTDGMIYTAYTIDGLSYRDFPDGYTTITGATSGFTKEEVFNEMLTRNEHFLGFIDEPTIYSDIFVERGKQGVLENNLRLTEIDNLGELDVYGNGYFNVLKQ